MPSTLSTFRVSALLSACHALGVRKKAAGVSALVEAVAKYGGNDQLIYELTKMLCMNARKMNVAIGQDLLGQQVQAPRLSATSPQPPASPPQLKPPNPAGG